ncbi:MAG: hypothetical protein AB1758_06835 [Candidatus Eremiobacterota bacterium]
MVVALLGVPASAQMAEQLRTQFHKQEELGVRIVSEEDLGSLERLLGNPDVKVICLQVLADKVDEAMAVKLLDWVREGHSLWLYDSRLGKYFGFVDFALKDNMFAHKPETGEYGSRKLDGVATVALAFGTHAVVTGVGQATVFLPYLKEEERYPAVEVKGDTVPVLRFTHDSPALVALRREGRGLIVFKPLMWTIPYSGDRLQSNLLEFSAGYQVPGLAGTEKVGDPPGPKAEYVVGEPAAPLAGASVRVPATPMPPDPTATPSPPPTVQTAGMDRVSLAGDVVEGTVVNQEFRFETGGSSMTLKKADIRRVDVGGSLDLDRLTTVKGDSFKGLLLTRRIEVESKEGRRIIEKQEIRTIEFSLP